MTRYVYNETKLQMEQWPEHEAMNTTSMKPMQTGAGIQASKRKSVAKDEFNKIYTNEIIEIRILYNSYHHRHGKGIRVQDKHSGYTLKSKSNQ